MLISEKQCRSFSIIMLMLVWTSVSAFGQQEAERIHLNQIGFYPEADKIAAVVGASASGFHVLSTTRADTVFTSTLGEPRTAETSSEQVRLADFSALEKPGEFIVDVPGVGTSHPVRIEPRVHEDLARAALKAFYFQRASTALPEEYADRWSRTAGHPDDEVLVHSSAATDERPEDTRIAAPKGWYDAGDYNKYIVNSGITMGTLLSVYEDFPSYVEQLSTHIPESDSDLPDLLDEILWNLRWMLDMQDPHGGGVYHKLTTPNFEGIVMPDEAQMPRYVVQKSTAAALNFAAVTAQASRIFRGYEHAVPGLADSTLTASLDAWNWARANPEVYYQQNQMNEVHDPDILTGTYGDTDVSDEFIWAASELYTTTRADSFYTAVDMHPDDEIPVPAWRHVESLGYYTLLRHRNNLTTAASADLDDLERRFIRHADSLVTRMESAAYRSVMGKTADDFIWGSNSVAANQGIALIQAHTLTEDPQYLRAALSNLDYILGRNATGYSFVTGHGSKTPMNPHHRPSEASLLDEPVPGLLAGGPNPGQQDGCEYPSDEPALSYVDDWCSYASNEIAINWNAPLVYLAAAIEALQHEAGDAGATP